MKRIRLIGKSQRDYAKAQIDAAPDGWIVHLREPTRSLEANAALWAALEDLASQVEWPLNGTLQKLSKEDWKDLATAEMMKEQRLATGMSGGFVFLGRHTSNMTKSQFSDLLTIIHEFGDRNGVVWSAREVAA